GIERAVEFELGTAFLPRLEGYDEVGNNVVGGGCLWTMAGASEEELDAIWRFYQHLSSTEMDTIWHKGTGYFPASNATVEALEAEGWFEQNPNFRTAFDQILAGNNTLESAGVLLGDFVLIRDIVGAAIEDVVVNGVDPQEALDFATEESNQVLADYASLFAE
ncbi:MAG: extracellular solute-binding protein, partial [Chloroflexota bacterium]